MRKQRARPFHRPLRLIIAIFWSFVSFFALLGSVGLGVYYFVSKDEKIAKLFLYSLPVVAVLIAIRMIYEAKVTCPLCHGPPLKEKRSMKHREARKIPLLGYRRTAILDILLRGWYTCMYCGTPFRLKR